MLPQFERPPLIEVALSAQFEPLESLSVPQLGLLWQRFRGRFPQVEHRPPLVAVIERTGTRAASAPPPVEFVSAPPVPRLWFLDESRGELLQVQQDRFVRNWRKRGESDRYPRYEEHVRPRFAEDLATFVDFITENGLGTFAPNQCEVTYVNHIVAGEIWRRHIEVDRVFAGLTPRGASTEALALEDERFALRYVLRDDSGDFLGRLHVAVEPAFRQEDDRPMLLATLTARGRPLGAGLEGVLGFLDLGRASIVRTFAALTTPEMHREWGRTDG
jgi:uncharacterized protein (TIGR04255 family)